MSKIKKYTIDEEIPKGVKASNLLKIQLEKVKDGREYLNSLNVHIDKRKEVTYFYFLVEEEDELKSKILSALETINNLYE